MAIIHHNTLIVKEKLIDDKKKIKTRSCAGAFEEEQYFPINSPTCFKEGLCLKYCMIASNKLLLNFLDVKTAFLQRKLIEQTAYVWAIYMQWKLTLPQFQGEENACMA